MNSRLARLRDRLLILEDGLLALLLTSMILLAAVQILLRNVWASGLSWGDPALRVMVLWIALLGAMAATRDHNHIQIDILSRYLPANVKRWTDRIGDLFAAIVCALITWHGARFVHFEWQDGMLLFASVPAWVCELIIPLGFGVMALRFLLSALLGKQQEGPS